MVERGGGGGGGVSKAGRQPVLHAAEGSVSCLLHQALHLVPPTLLQILPLLHPLMVRDRVAIQPLC